MQMVQEQRGESMLITLGGRLDVTSAPEFQDACVGLADSGVTDVVVDMSGLEYISSAGLRSVLFSAKKLRGKGGDLRFCGLSGMVEDVFRVSGFQAMFTISPTVGDLLG